MMLYHVHLTDEAKLDIKKAAAYYLKINASLQEKFKTTLIKAIDALKKNPKNHQIKYRGIRIAHTTTFPYGVHFLIERNTIRVLKVVHHKQVYK